MPNAKKLKPSWAINTTFLWLYVFLSISPFAFFISRPSKNYFLLQTSSSVQYFNFWQTISYRFYSIDLNTQSIFVRAESFIIHLQSLSKSWKFFKATVFRRFYIAFSWTNELIRSGINQYFIFEILVRFICIT